MYDVWLLVDAHKCMNIIDVLSYVTVHGGVWYKSHTWTILHLDQIDMLPAGSAHLTVSCYSPSARQMDIPVC